MPPPPPSFLPSLPFSLSLSLLPSFLSFSLLPPCVLERERERALGGVLKGAEEEEEEGDYCTYYVVVVLYSRLCLCGHLKKMHSKH